MSATGEELHVRQAQRTCLRASKGSIHFCHHGLANNNLHPVMPGALQTASPYSGSEFTYQVCSQVQLLGREAG